MAQPYLSHVDHACVWRGNDPDLIDAVTIAMTDRHLTALDDALQSVRESGLTVENVDQHSFALPDLTEDLAAIEHEILHGRGIVLLRGFPLEGYSPEDIELMYWGLGCHLGNGESQSNLGDRVGRVEDISGKDYSERAYRNSIELMMHTDLTDIIAMLSVRKAPRGGLSKYVSAATLHNEVLATRPDLLAPLYNGFRYHRFGGEGPGEEAITPHRIPVLSEKDGHVSARYVPDYVYMAAEELGEPLTPIEVEALDYFNALADREDLRLDVTLEPGDISIINNFTVMHTRDAFWDGESADEKRLLLRLWLTTEYERPVVDTLAMFSRDGIEAQPGKGTYYSGTTDPLSQLGPSASS